MRQLILTFGVLAYLASGLWAGDERPAAASNEIVGPKLSAIRLGRTQDEIITEYGKPLKTVTFVSGIESLSYQHEGIRLLVEISPKTKRVIQIYHFKTSPFTGTQIAELLERNSEGSKWRPIPTTEGGYRFERADGGTMRTNVLPGEFMLAFLSGSEVRGRNPEADAARKREVEESLKEIE